MASSGIYARRARVVPRRKRIVVCWEGPSILACAIHTILKEQKELEVSGVDMAGQDPLAFLKTARLDIVVVVSHQDCLNFRPNLAEVFSAPHTAMVVLLCGCDHKVRIYGYHEAELAGWDDFLSLFRAKTFPIASPLGLSQASYGKKRSMARRRNN